jgi:hypothetical protein
MVVSAFVLRLFTALALSLLLAAPAAADGFEGWAPLGAYERTALREGSSFLITLPTQGGSVEVSFQPRETLAARYHAEAVGPRGLREGRGRPQVATWTGEVSPAHGRDFAKLAYRGHHGSVSGLLRVEGLLYDLSAELAAGDLLLTVREITPEQLGEVLQGCGVEADEALAALDGEGAAGSGPESAAAGALKEIELGTEADYLFVAQTGGVDAANAKILSMINAVNGIYETDLGLTNRVVVQRAWNGSDPYTSSDSGTLLSEFRSSYSAGVGTTYDDAQLFSGRDFESSVIGRAWLSSACGSYRYGVNQYYNQSENLTRLVVAHEEGHNLGGSHSTDGGIMSPSINSSVTWFSNNSKAEIGAFVAGIGCLADVAVGGPPVLDPVGPQSVSENATLSLQLTADDPDGDALSFDATPLPVGASITPDGFFQYTPPSGTVGCGGSAELDIQFLVTDAGGNQASEVVPVSVFDTPTGAAPQLADPADRSVSAGQLVSIQLSASDPDGDDLTYTASGLPAGASLSGAGLFSWTPGNGDAGDNVVAFQATDCTNASASQSVTISVNPVLPPHLSSLSPDSGAADSQVTISGQHFAGSSVSVHFGSKLATILGSTDTTLVVIAPRQGKKVTSVGVSVTRDGLSSDNALTFTYGGSTGGGGGGSGGGGKGGGGGGKGKPAR